mmetsp:Transcript_5692/g.10451  ORF Transcript_5692/g.10451 Transcript_5692/m.10451 type:complete len:484 (+) Transcript_5692:215-1666(+)
MLDRASWRFWGVLAVICLAQVADADTDWQVQLQLDTGIGSVTMTFESVFKSNLANYIGATSSDIQIVYTGNANTVTALVTFTGVDAGGFAVDLQSSPINALSNALNVPIVGTIGTAERVTEPPVTERVTEPPVTTPVGSPVAAPVQSPVNAPVHAPTAPTSIAGESPGPTELLNEYEVCLSRCEEKSACPSGYCGTGYCCQSGVPDMYCGGDFGCDGFHCCTRVATQEPTTQPPSPVVAPTEPPSASESVSPTAAPTRVRTFLVEVVMEGSNDQLSDAFKSQMKNNLAEFLGITADDLTVEFSQTTSSAENDNLQAEVTFKSESTALQLSTSQLSDVTAALNTTVIRIGNVTEVFDMETKGEKNGGGGGGGGGGSSSYGNFGGRSYRPSNFKPGDWMCSCGAHNYQSRTECYKCGNSKEEGQTEEKQSSSRNSKGYLPYNFKPGDWMCPNPECSAHNYQSRSECYKCNEARPAEKEDMAEGKE